MKLELVVWYDAVANAGWEDLGKGDKPHLCNTIGVISVDEPTHICIGGTWAELDGQVQTNNRMTIPVGFIVSRQVLDLDALRIGKVLKPLTAAQRLAKISASSQRKPFK